MQGSIIIQLEHFFEKQSPENFINLREAVAASPDYAPYASNYMDKVYALLEQEQFEEAKNHLMTVMANWILNPGIHTLASFVFQKLGRDNDARFEYGVSQLFLEGILSTGDGSETRPYLVLHTADEYDVLAHFDRKSQKQALVEKEGRHYDRQECQDGSQIWFDITIPYEHLRRQVLAGQV